MWNDAYKFSAEFQELHLDLLKREALGKWIFKSLNRYIFCMTKLWVERSTTIFNSIFIIIIRPAYHFDFIFRKLLEIESKFEQGRAVTPTAALRNKRCCVY